MRNGPRTSPNRTGSAAPIAPENASARRRRCDDGPGQQQDPRPIAPPVDVQVRPDRVLAGEGEGERPARDEDDRGHERVGEEDPAPRLGDRATDEGEQGESRDPEAEHPRAGGVVDRERRVGEPAQDRERRRPSHPGSR